MCGQCGKVPPLIGAVRCGICRDDKNERESARKKQRVDDGLCKNCGGVIENNQFVRCDKCRTTNALYSKTARTKFPDRSSDHFRTIHLDAIKIYSNNTMRCQCCQEDNLLFLTIDHIDNDGAQHRRDTNNASGKNLAWWLKKHNYPNGFQVLCFNCNMGKCRNDGRCPHTKHQDWLYDQVPIVDGKKRYNRKYDRAVFFEAVQTYGPVCVCCEEDNIFFLSIDHIDNNGAAHRREIGGKSGKNLAWWLRKREWPDGYQILCFNCNCGRARNNSICPHRLV